MQAQGSAGNGELMMNRIKSTGMVGLLTLNPSAAKGVTLAKISVFFRPIPNSIELKNTKILSQRPPFSRRRIQCQQTLLYFEHFKFIFHSRWPKNGRFYLRSDLLLSFHFKKIF